MIRIIRESRYMDSLRTYNIFIDGIYYGDIKRGEIKEINLDNGVHSIYLTIDWCRSNKLDFEVSNNSCLEFICGNSMKGLKYLLAILYITVLKNSYLFIKRL